MSGLFHSLLFVIIVYGCNSKIAGSTSEGFNLSDADKKDLADAENKMFDEIIKFGD